MLPTPSQFHDLFFNTHTHVHTLLSPFCVAPMCTCLGTTVWDWETFQGSHPWRKLILPLAEAVTYLWLFIEGYGAL